MCHSSQFIDKHTSQSTVILKTCTRSRNFKHLLPTRLPEGILCSPFIFFSLFHGSLASSLPPLILFHPLESCPHMSTHAYPLQLTVRLHGHKHVLYFDIYFHCYCYYFMYICLFSFNSLRSQTPAILCLMSIQYNCHIVTVEYFLKRIHMNILHCRRF